MHYYKNNHTLHKPKIKLCQISYFEYYTYKLAHDIKYNILIFNLKCL